MKQRKCKLIMVTTTDDKAPIMFGYDGLLKLYSYSKKAELTDTLAHLHIYNDDDIKNGDLVLINCSELEIKDSVEVFNEQIDKCYCKKIVFTTDDEYCERSGDKISVIPLDFVDFFMNSYNNENKLITDIIVYTRYNNITNIYPLIRNSVNHTDKPTLINNKNYEHTI